MRIRFVALCLLALVSSGLLPASAGAEAGEGRLSGVARLDHGATLGRDDAIELRDSTSGVLVASARPDDRGRYSVAVPKGTYDLEITTSRREDWEAHVNAVEVGETSSLDLVVVRPYVTFRGSVQDGRGNPLSGVRLTLHDQRGPGAVTATDGTFKLSAPPGRYDLELGWRQDWASNDVDVLVEDFDLTRERKEQLTLPFVDVGVTVHDDSGGRIDHGWVQMHGGCLRSCRAPFELFPGARTSARWDFSIRPNSAPARGFPGAATLQVWSDHPSTGGITRSMNLTSSATLDVVLRNQGAPVTFRGRLLDGNGNGVEGTVSLANDETGGGSQSDDDGSFAVSVPPGRYRLKVSADLHTVRERQGMESWAYVEGAFVTLDDFELDADRTQDLTLPVTDFTVHVYDDAGQPARAGVRGASGDVGEHESGDAAVELFPGGVGRGLLVNKTNAVSDATGTATLKIFAGAPPPVVSVGWGYSTIRVPIEPGADSAEVHLPPLYIAQGSVRDARGPLPGYFRFEVGSFPGDYSIEADSYAFRGAAGRYGIKVGYPYEDYDDSYEHVASETLPAYWSISTDYELTRDANVDLTIPDALPADVLVTGPDGAPLGGYLNASGSTSGLPLAPGLTGTGYTGNSLTEDTGHFRPLLFGPSELTVVFRDPTQGHRDVLATFPLAPGRRVALALTHLFSPPGRPGGVQATPGDSAAYVTWTPPEEDGGDPIVSYEVSTWTPEAYAGSEPPVTTTVPGSARSVKLPVRNGVEYLFRVAATNRVGTGNAEDHSEFIFVGTRPVPTTTTTRPGPTTTTTTTVLDGPPAAKSGYWMVGSDGKVYPFGDAKHLGEPELGSAEAVDLEPSPSGNGYWVLDERGRVYAYGDAKHMGDAAPTGGEKATSLSASDKGYWVFTSTGRVQPFGDAQHYGDMSHLRLNGPVLDSVATPSGRGYYMVASDGGVFTFGDAVFAGSMGGWKLNAPVQSLVPDGDGDGYWLVASDGGIFAFGAPFRGSMGGKRLNRPVTGMVRFGNGYLMVGEDGGIFNFSDRAFHGSLGDRPPAKPVVAVAARPM